jgi:AraC-like DNA-binding protein
MNSNNSRPRQTARTEIDWRNAHPILEPLMNAQGLYTWSFDPLFPVDVCFYTYDQRKHLRPNRHDYFELFYLFHGEMTFQIHRQCFKMKAGDLAVIGSTFFHRPVVHGFSQVKGIVLCFLPKAILGKDPSDEDLESLMPFIAQDESFRHMVPAGSGIPAKVLELIKLIHAELPARSVHSRLNARTYLKMVLVLLGNHYADYRGKLRQFHSKVKNIHRLRPVLDFIDENLAERIAVSDVASMVYMSKSRFIHFFKSVTGQPFVTYLKHLRVARAEWLLTATDIPLADLCRLVGFCDQSYFGATFRKSVGMTPAQYRRKFSGAHDKDPSNHNWPSGVDARFMTHSGMFPEELIPQADARHSGLMRIKPGGPVQ